MWIVDHAVSQTVEGMSGGGPRETTMVGISWRGTRDGTLVTVVYTQISFISRLRGTLESSATLGLSSVLTVLLSCTLVTLVVHTENLGSPQP